MKEIWKDVVGFEGGYQVSNLGRIKTKERNVYHPTLGTVIVNEKIRKQTTAFNGYKKVNMSFDGKRKYMSVHRMVCEAFNGPQPSNNHQVAHNDGCKTNNNSLNLRWATAKENTKDRSKHGNHYVSKGEKCSLAKLTKKDVLNIRNIWNKGDRSQSKIAKQYNVSQSCISKIINKQRWNHI